MFYSNRPYQNYWGRRNHNNCADLKPRIHVAFYTLNIPKFIRIFRASYNLLRYYDRGLCKLKFEMNAVF
jgi:hypothetical protein